MALTKQSLRQGVHVMIDGELATKEELIKLSEDWTEKKEIFFRKMLHQGGIFSMGGKDFHIIIRQNIKERSDGQIDGGVVPIPGDSAF